MNDGRVNCGAPRNGHEGEGSARFLIGLRRGAVLVGTSGRVRRRYGPCVTRRGVRAATGHEKGRSGQVTGRPAQKMHLVATISEI